MSDEQQEQSSVAPIYLTREEILGAPNGRRFATVPVDEWRKGAVVRVSSLSSEMRDELESYLIASREAGGLHNLRARYVWLCAVGADGKRLFTDVADVEALGNLSAAPIDRIFAETLKINDISDAAVEVEAKNFEGEASDISL